MNIKSMLITLVISSLVCLTALPVQADTSRFARDKHDESSRQNHRGDREYDKDKAQRSNKQRSTKPSKEKLRQEKHRNPNDEHKQDRKKSRPADRQPVKRLDNNRQTKPVKRSNNERHDKPATWRDKNLHDRPSSGSYTKHKRHAKPVARVKRPKHRIIYRDHIKRNHRYIRGPWYYTRYIRPFSRHYHPIGFRINILPNPYVRIVIGGFPYFYYSGIYYRSHSSGYIVVGAPIGAFVSSLPEGFIAFTIGLSTYYYINDAYYAWNDYRDGYLVVEKPIGADKAIEKATSGRLVVYPNKDQTEEQQAKDRYECHRWAVTESGFDPTMEEEEYAAEDSDIYRRAIAACLEGRDYTVK